MKGSDFLAVVTWWAWLLVLGLVFFPLACRLFGRFFDRGYLFAKTIGIALVAYVVWLAASLGLMPFARWTILAVLVAGALAAYLPGKYYRRIPQLLRDRWHIFAAEELLFALGLVLWAYIRSLKPDINGLEKFMDYGFVTSILRAEYFPPLDMWFAEKTINYYYFGHYIAAFLTRLTAVESSVAYNLMIATVFAFTLALVFSLAANLVRLLSFSRPRNAILAGAISALLVSLGGNLHCVIYTMAAPAAHKMRLTTQPAKAYWYPDATRYIGYNPPTHDKTIHEFPIYSFVVADLHGHVSNIPFVLTLLAILLVLMLAPAGPDDPWWKILGESILIGFALTLFYMTNSWDLPIYLVISVVVLAFRNSRRYGLIPPTIFNAVPAKPVHPSTPKSKSGKHRQPERPGKETALSNSNAPVLSEGLSSEEAQSPLGKSVLATSLQILEIVVAYVVLFGLPFHLNFVNFSKGVGIVKHRSPIYQLLVLWGYQLFFVAVFVTFLIWQWRRWKKARSWSLTPVDLFVLILCAASVGLLIAPEFVYLRDIYGGDFARANTMFKLTYQAFMMLGLAAGFIILRILLIPKDALYQHATVLAFGFILALPLMYPLQAIKGYYGVDLLPRETQTNPQTPRIPASKGLAGLNFLAESYPDDYKAIQWLGQNVTGQPAVLEANGDSYTQYGRVSMTTGLPTILGWYVHEWLWRGDGKFPNERVPEVARIYEAADPKLAHAALKKYHIQYIFVGKLEREKFKKLNEPQLQTFGREVFKSGNTYILKVHDNILAPK